MLGEWQSSKTYYAFSFLASEAKTVIADEPLYDESEKETAFRRFWVAPELTFIEIDVNSQKRGCSLRTRNSYPYEVVVDSRDYVIDAFRISFGGFDSPADHPHPGLE